MNNFRFAHAQAQQMLSRILKGQDVLAVIGAKVSVYAAFTKLRLSSLVVFSAVMTYFLAADNISWVVLFALIAGGFMITGASNGMNQLLEKDYDALMDRTRNRPLPSGHLSVSEGLILSVILAVIGVFLLYFLVNPLSGLLGSLAVLLYVGIYTPMKRISSWSVIIGAVPGAIPPMLGAVAATGSFGLLPGMLFALQFAWQLPHFWSIAWKIDADYKKAGYRMLPIYGEKDSATSWVILATAGALVLTGLLIYTLGFFSVIGLTTHLIFSGLMVYYSLLLVARKTDQAAKGIMFGSFAYLPLVLIAFLLDKIWLI